MLTLVYVAFYLADYLVISRAFVSPTVHLVLFVLVVRLFSARRDRDHYFLAVIAFLMVLAAAVLTVDSTFLLAFARFMLTAVVTFILMEMRHAAPRPAFRANSSSDDLGLPADGLFSGWRFTRACAADHAGRGGHFLCAAPHFELDI